MQALVIDNTDVRVSRISFGTASLHHIFGARQRQGVLEAAATEGISHFDTSPYYGYGVAEADLGVFLQGRRNAFTVATKVGLYPFGGGASGTLSVWVRKGVGKVYPRLSVPEVNWCIQRAAQSLDDSLRRLRTDYVDFLFLHEPDICLLNADEWLVWVKAEQSKGKLRHWGLAGSPELLKPWLEINHPLGNVLQTRDDLATKAADFILARGRPLQFTYGYLSARPALSATKGIGQVLFNALERNTHGSILISTRRIQHMRQLAGLGL